MNSYVLCLRAMAHRERFKISHMQSLLSTVCFAMLHGFYVITTTAAVVDFAILKVFTFSVDFRRRRRRRRTFISPNQYNI